jgi:hypothetical protein
MDVTNDTAVTVNGTERRIAFMVAGVVGLSLLCIIVDIIALAAGVDTGKQPWSILWVFPGVGLPIGLLLMIALLILGVRRRSREAREQEEAAAAARAAKPVTQQRAQPRKKK